MKRKSKSLESKMCQGSFPEMRQFLEQYSAASSARKSRSSREPAKENGSARVWQPDRSDMRRGAYWGLNISEFPNGGGEFSSLASVLEKGFLPHFYYLSKRACQGILRRAEKRGRRLPIALQAALEVQAQKNSN